MRGSVYRVSMALLSSLCWVVCHGELQPLETSMNNSASIFLSETADPSWAVSLVGLQRDSGWEMNGGETGVKADLPTQTVP